MTTILADEQHDCGEHTNCVSNPFGRRLRDEGYWQQLTSLKEGVTVHPGQELLVNYGNYFDDPDSECFCPTHVEKRAEKDRVAALVDQARKDKEAARKRRLRQDPEKRSEFTCFTLLTCKSGIWS